ncbi:MAG TPA: M23 family metallopeptidase [Nannocystaceae bacterium]|nr:M23 family metallopeptidase [Nannocystaceae bacterium]
MSARTIALAPALAFGLATTAAAEEPFYAPVGELVPGSGQGLADETVYAPGMRYPIESGPSYPNSQVWGVGGSEGPAGSQCDAANFSYPWHDNYCEERSWDMPLCPAGVGHQGQDTRAATCDDDVHPTVAAADGTITSIGSYSIYLTDAGGTRYDYLHSTSILVSEGDAVTREERLSRVSNQFGGTPTTVHLHFNLSQDVAGVGFVYVSPYMSMVAAYEDLMGLGNEVPAGPVDAVDCASIRGWAQDPDTPEQPVEIRVWFGGPADDPNATGVTLLADQPRDDLCEPLGSCEHGFDIEIPKSLRDDQSHAVYVYAVDTEGSEAPLLDASPGEFACAPPAAPAGVRRAIAGPDALAAWGFSTFWDLANLDDAAVQAIPQGEPLADEPLVVRGETDPEDLIWLVDQGRKRSLADPAARAAWHIDPAMAKVWPQESVTSIPEGPAVRAEVFLVDDLAGVLYVVDDPVCPPNETCDGDDDGTGEGAGNDDGTAGGGADDGDGSGGDGGGAPGAGEDASGCGCTSAPMRGPCGWWSMLLAAYGRRRSSNMRVNAARE